MAYTTINKPNQYFNTVLWTGDGTTKNITGVGFQPDLVWAKKRSATGFHAWCDAVRGGTKNIFSNSDAIEETSATDWILSFVSDGFGVNSAGNLNQSTATYVAWNWLANGAGVSNTAGTISSTVSANQTAGFSIVSYTGNGTSGATIGHGLGVAPKMIIVKNRTRVDAWPVDIRFASGILYLNETGSKGSYGAIEPFTSTAPTSTVFSVGSAGNTNFNTSNLIAYCFAEIKGFSKFGSYTGNGSTDGTFIYTGFKPAFVMIKQTSAAGEGWEMADDVRSTYNVVSTFLRGNSNAAESTNTDRQFDFLSNGIKMRGSHGSTNGSGATYIYMCFAENPFVSSTLIPTTAR